MYKALGSIPNKRCEREREEREERERERETEGEGERDKLLKYYYQLLKLFFEIAKMTLAHCSKILTGQVQVAHTYNPSYSGGRVAPEF
jgi:hypothetical protein